MKLAVPSALNLPARGPRTNVPTNAERPPVTCTTPDPAKSITPQDKKRSPLALFGFAQPSAPHTQCATTGSVLGWVGLGAWVGGSRGRGHHPSAKLDQQGVIMIRTPQGVRAVNTHPREDGGSFLPIRATLDDEPMTSSNVCRTRLQKRKLSCYHILSICSQPEGGGGERREATD